MQIQRRLSQSARNSHSPLPDTVLHLQERVRHHPLDVMISKERGTGWSIEYISAECVLIDEGVLWFSQFEN